MMQVHLQLPSLARNDRLQADERSEMIRRLRDSPIAAAGNRATTQMCVRMRYQTTAILAPIPQQQSGASRAARIVSCSFRLGQSGSKACSWLSPSWSSLADLPFVGSYPAEHLDQNVSRPADYIGQSVWTTLPQHGPYCKWKFARFLGQFIGQSMAPVQKLVHPKHGHDHDCSL